MFNDRYGLTDAVLYGRKTMTRRVIPKDIAETLIIEGDDVFPDIPCEGLMEYSRYKVGEVVAVAQSYCQVFDTEAKFRAAERKVGQVLEAGYRNKMFVKAELMPHRIRITDIRVERLQDISDEDCLREGVMAESIFNDNDYCTFLGSKCAFKSPRGAFAALIDKVSGKGTWESNPFVWVYSFELIK